MPSQHIKDENWNEIKKITIGKIKKKGVIVKEGEVLDKALKLGIEELKKRIEKES